MFDFWKKVCLNIVGASAFQPKELNPEDFYFSPLDFCFTGNFFQIGFGRALQEEKIIRLYQQMHLGEESSFRFGACQNESSNVFFTVKDEKNVFWPIIGII